MDPAAIAGLCLMLARGQAPGPPPLGVVCAPARRKSAALAPAAGVGDLAPLIDAPEAREGVARVSFAEAGNQGDSGLAGVVYTILNRLADGGWGRSVDGVLNGHSQFEPVMRVGGDWRRLPPVSAAQQARIDTILNLALDGRLPDLTNGARYFQNPTIVAARAPAGVVEPHLVNFGGQTPTAVIGAHSFYAGQGPGGGGRSDGANPPPQHIDALFVGDNRTDAAIAASAPASADASPTAAATGPVGDPSRGLFVSPDGVVRAARP